MKKFFDKIFEIVKKIKIKKEIIKLKEKIAQNEFYKEHIDKKKLVLCFYIILFLAIFLGTYKVTTIPNGLHVDEAGMAYDSYCISNYGVDRYLNKLPVYLINFGQGQSVLYTYLESLLIKCVGLSVLSIRLPSIIFGIISIIVSYLLVKNEYGNKFALLFMMIITISPWHIMAYRWGLDCNLLSPMIIISIYLLVNSKNKIQYILAGLSMGLTLYTYALSYIIIPIFLALSTIYMLYTKKIKIINVIIYLIPIILLAIPLLLTCLINLGCLDEIKSFITIPKLPIERMTEIKLSNIINNIQNIKFIFMGDWLEYNAFPAYGTLYLFTIPFCIMGIIIEIKKMIVSIRNKKFSIGSLMLFLALATIICVLLIVDPNINKANAIFISLIFFVCVAIKDTYLNYKKMFWIIYLLYLIEFIFFIKFYFIEYNKVYENQKYFDHELMPVVSYVEEKYNDKEIYIMTQISQPYIYTLLNDKTSPYDYNQTFEEHDDWFKYGKYYFYKKEIDEDAVFIVKENDELINNLEKQKFKFEYINNYTVAYK